MDPLGLSKPTLRHRHKNFSDIPAMHILRHEGVLPPMAFENDLEKEARPVTMHQLRRGIRALPQTDRIELVKAGFSQILKSMRQ